MLPFSKDTTSNTSSYRVVIPFYIYASVSFLIACFLLFCFSEAFLGHYFQPHILAITHTMALGWGTMIILGASHQLVPVIIEGKLYSQKLAYLSFVFAATGIPLLVFGFYTFNMGTPAKWGGQLVVIAILLYLINIFISMTKSKGDNIHGIFILTATVWLLLTTLLGLMMVYNFTRPLMKHDSLHYLPLHAHTGIIGWFLLLVIGVASRLIPMFLISKYTNVRLLWIIYFLLNITLVSYFMGFYTDKQAVVAFIPLILAFCSIALFIYYCFQSYKQRLRKQVDEQLKISLLSVLMLLLPIILLLAIVGFMTFASGEKSNLILAYGFVIFFGWLTAIILGMTFKTLPFIVWNRIHQHQQTFGKTLSPKDLFSQPVFKWMCMAYLFGFTIFVTGILSERAVLLKAGGLLLTITAVFYNWNIIRLVNHKVKIR